MLGCNDKGSVHILRHAPRGEEGVSKSVTIHVKEIGKCVT